MADYTVEITLPDHKLGDQWVGITAIGPMTITGFTKGVLSRIRMHFTNGTVIFTCDTNGLGNALIVISNPNTWIARIDPVTKFLSRAGAWSWDMEFTHANAISPVTLYKGTINVIQDITK